jgi:hypothetical protein
VNTSDRVEGGIESKARPDGWAELEDAWKIIVASKEVRDLVSGGVATARDLLARRGDLIAGVLGLGVPAAQLRQAA